MQLNILISLLLDKVLGRTNIPELSDSTNIEKYRVAGISRR
jgi:hypothetical protein